MNPDDTIDDEPSKQEGRRGGEATAFEAPVLVCRRDCLKTASVGGLIGGLVFLAYSTLLNIPQGPLTSVRVFASLVWGEAALSGRGDIALTVVTGLFSAAILSLFWGALFGVLLASFHSEWTPANIVSAGMVYGSVVWLIDFYVLSPVFWPWVVPMSSASIFFGFVFFFGLPMGVWIASRAMR